MFVQQLCGIKWSIRGSKGIRRIEYEDMERIEHNREDDTTSDLKEGCL